MVFHFPPDSGRVRRVTRRACAACGKARPAVTVTACRQRCPWRPWPRAVAGAGRDGLPRQLPQLGVQAGLVALHDQDVVRFLAGDQVIGMLALGMQCIGGDDGSGEVQRVQQRREPGDLIGLAVHGGLREDGQGLLVDGGQQVRGLAAGGGVPGAAQGLAVHGHDAAPAAPAAVALASQDVTAASNWPASTASRTRRMVASPGGRNRPASGSKRMPSAASTPGGASATHSPIAASDCAPARTAATEASSTEASEWRTPRGSRGSGTARRYSRRPGYPAGRS